MVGAGTVDGWRGRGRWRMISLMMTQLTQLHHSLVVLIPRGSARARGVVRSADATARPGYSANLSGAAPVCGHPLREYTCSLHMVAGLRAGSTAYEGRRAC